jgi:hypothetical protein
MRLRVRHADAAQRVERKLFGLRVGFGADEGADHDVLQHGHARERAHHLPGPPDAARADRVRLEPADRAAGETHRALVGGEEAVDDVEQRGLAGAVRPDDAVNHAFGHASVTSSTAIGRRTRATVIELEDRRAESEARGADR